MSCRTELCVSGLAGDQGARWVVVQSCVLAGWLVIKELSELSYRVVCKRVGW